IVKFLVSDDIAPMTTRGSRRPLAQREWIQRSQLSPPPLPANNPTKNPQLRYSKTNVVEANWLRTGAWLSTDILSSSVPRRTTPAKSALLPLRTEYARVTSAPK